jgi:putative aldouronate transport system substrate-binding protein
MTKVNLKLSAALMAILLLMFAVVGCSTSTDISTEAETTESTEATEAPETTDEETTTEEDPYAISFPYTGEEITFTYLWADIDQLQGDEIEDEMIVAKAISEAIGNITFDVELLSWDDFDTKVALYLSSGEIPDIMVVRDVLTTTQDYGTNGTLLDYSQYMETYMPNYSALSEEYTALDLIEDETGAIYGLPTNFYDMDWVMESWFYNADLLDELGIEVPETQDEFLEALRTIKAADEDIIPFNNVWGMAYLIQAMSLMYDSDTAYTAPDSCVQYNTETGEWEFGPYLEDSQFKSFLEFLNTLWEEELINMELNTAADEQVWAQVEEGNFGFTYYYFGIQSDNNIEGVNFGNMLTPTGESGTAYSQVTTACDGVPSWGIVTGVDCENPEILAQLLDYMMSDEMTTLQVWGIEDETYTINDEGEYEYTDNMQTALNLDGTTTFSELGFATELMDRMMGISVVSSSVITSYDELGYNSYNNVTDALDAGTLTARYAVSKPTLTSEESETVSAILTPIETYIEECMYKFIMGDMSFDEWDDFIANIGEYGDIQTVLDIYNSYEMTDYSGTWR